VSGLDDDYCETINNKMSNTTRFNNVRTLQFHSCSIWMMIIQLFGLQPVYVFKRKFLTTTVVYSLISYSFCRPVRRNTFAWCILSWTPLLHWFLWQPAKLINTQYGAWHASLICEYIDGRERHSTERITPRAVQPQHHDTVIWITSWNTKWFKKSTTFPTVYLLWIHALSPH